jgi:aminoglycoside phosphotransferase (APT) family kinase protein
VLVHGDFHYNNVLSGHDGRPVVIDWSNARLADPRQDLAWLAVVTAGDRDISIYEHVTGHRVISLDFFEAIASVRVLADVMATLTSAAVSGQLQEAASRMRKGSEHTQYVATRLQDIVPTPMPGLMATLDELLHSPTPTQ